MWPVATAFEPLPPLVAPPSRGRPYWLFISAGCLVPAVLDALQSYIKERIGGAVHWNDVIFSGSEWIFLGALVPIAWILARRFPLRREHLGRTLGAHFAGAFALVLGWASLGILEGVVLHTGPVGQRVALSWVAWVMTTVPYGVFMYFGMLGCIYAFMYFTEAREREAQQARLAAQLAEARLGALRMQLNPHFLFNSLNAIAVLVRDQNTRDASRMLELLGGVLRQVLHGESRQRVTLDQELRFIEKYLEIEQVRFSDRLRVEWRIEPGAREVLVPEFVLQPLVENAIRHGVAKRSEPGTIEIAARIDSAVLVLSVRDDGPGVAGEMGESGVGLANTRERLSAIYGDASALAIAPAPGGGTIATLRIPVHAA